MGLNRTIDITAGQRKTVLALLARHLPNTAAWVYGSRAKWTSRPQSDLDLVVFATPEQASRVSDLREAFEESILPFRVDLFVWDAVPEQFHKQIKRDHVVLVEREERAVAGGWCEAKLGDLLSFSNGKSSPRRSNGLPYPVYGSNGIIGFSNEANAEKNTIIVGRVGSYCGSLYYSDKNCWVTDNAIRANAIDGHEARFLYFLLQTLNLNDRRAGSGQPLLNQTILSSIPVTVPPLPEQHAIAHILGTLDDKIELNRRMNETLEAMARALFKSWFVDFDPVRAKMEGRDPGLPQHLADLFPDRLMNSEFGEIPEGWEVGTIKELAEVSSGKRPEVKYAEASDLAQVPLWGGNGPMAFVPDPLIKQPILLTGRVGTLGSVFRITSPCWPSDNTLIFKAKAKQAFEFLFFQLKRIDFTSLNRGSTQPLVTQTNLKAQIVLLPPANILERFHFFTKTLYEKLDESESESRTLAALRDTLLPKLISGEVRVRMHSSYMTDNEAEVYSS